MRIVMVLALLLAASQAAAQPIPDKSMEAISGKLGEEINAGLGWRAKALAAEARVRELQEELDKCQKNGMVK